MHICESGVLGKGGDGAFYRSNPHIELLLFSILKTGTIRMLLLIMNAVKVEGCFSSLVYLEIPLQTFRCLCRNIE